MRKVYILVIIGIVWAFFTGGCIRDESYIFAAISGALSLVSFFVAYTLKKNEDRKLKHEQELLAKFRKPPPETTPSLLPGGFCGLEAVKYPDHYQKVPYHPLQSR